MTTVLELLNLLLQVLDSSAFIILSAIGLAIIFGMMGVINLAHGEFIMIGAYGTVVSVNAGIPYLLAIVVGVGLTTVIGLVIERTIIKRLYGRLLDSMVATWGISLMIIEGTRLILGTSLSGIGVPLGSISYGQYSYSTYRILLAGVAVVLLIVLYWVFNHTDFGVRARATMQNPEMARNLGINTERMYLTTFGIGSGLAGLTGALYAPTMSIVPSMGSGFLVEAFVAVIVGGASPLVGTPIASGLLGIVNAVFSNLFSSFAGRIALLTATILVIRVLPKGITGLINRFTGREVEYGLVDQIE